MTLYKVTSPSGGPLHGGSGDWPLPHGRRPGRWRRVERPEDVQPCEHGLHLTDAENLTSWLPKCAFTVWEAEGRGTRRDERGKAVFSEARLLRAVATVDDPEWRLYLDGVAHDALPPTIDAALSGFAAFKERREAARREAAELELAAAQHDAKLAVRHSLRLVFGQHSLPPSETFCPAWPTGDELDRRRSRVTDQNTRRILGITEKAERLMRRSPTPELARLVYGVAS